MSDNQLPAERQPTDLGERNDQAAKLLADIVAASRDPAVDAGKTTALAELAMTMQDREAERRFRMAKHNALLEMPSISQRGAIKNKAGQVQSRYSKFEDMHRIVTPILAKHRLILSFNVGHEGQLVTVQPILAYSDGDLAFEEKGGEMVLAVDTTGSKNATQGAGSAASYGKRHAMKAMLNIIEGDEDDDGHGAGAQAAPFDALPPDRQALIDAARAAAKNGTDAYANYFDSLGKADKGFLAFNLTERGKSWHDENKEAAKAFD